MPTNDVMRVRTRGTVLGRPCEFGVHIRFASSSATADDLAASWVANIMPLVIQATSSATNWNSVHVSDVNPTGISSFEQPLSQPNPGAMAGDNLPPQSAALIKLTTGAKGGRKRGRLYVPGLTETANTNGVIGGTQLTNLEDLAAGLLTFYGPSGSELDYRLVVHSPEVLTFPAPKPKKPRPGVVTTQVTTTGVDTRVRSQRRRELA